MSKFSVKKPLTVFVAVIAILVLGVVAYLDMVPDLLPPTPETDSLAHRTLSSLTEIIPLLEELNHT